MAETKDIYKYDYMTIFVRPDAEEVILKAYAGFAWEVCERKQYGKSACVTLRRPHGIPDKDRLQLLQINMETAQSDLLKYSKRKHTFIKVFAVYLWLFGLASILFGVSVAVNDANAAVIIIGVLFVVLGLAVSVLTGVFFKRLIESERRNFGLRTEKAEEEMTRALEEAERLTYGK